MTGKMDWSRVEMEEREKANGSRRVWDTSTAPDCPAPDRPGTDGPGTSIGDEAREGVSQLNLTEAHREALDKFVDALLSRCAERLRNVERPPSLLVYRPTYENKPTKRLVESPKRQNKHRPIKKKDRTRRKGKPYVYVSDLAKELNVTTDQVMAEAELQGFSGSRGDSFLPLDIAQQVFSKMRPRKRLLLGRIQFVRVKKA